ncbi:ABC transporter permease [Bacteroidota bacterium]
MIKHLIKFSFRKIRRNLVFSIINIAGLSIGLATSFIILLYVADSSGYDRYNKKHNQIYRLISKHLKYDYRSNWNSYFIAQEIKNNIPDFTEVVKTSGRTYNISIQKGEEYIPEYPLMYADQNIFKVLSIELIEGDPETALANPFSVVITEEMATKYFGTVNPIGSSLSIKANGQDFDIMITGILKKIPRLSTFQANMIFSTELGIKIEGITDDSNKFDSKDFIIYALVNKEHNIFDIQNKLKQLTVRHKLEKDIEFKLQNIKDIHLKSDDIIYDNGRKGTLANVRIFSLVSILILLISSINYIIISISQSAIRNKEIAIRKISGVSRLGILKQILVESVLIALIALPTALVLVELLIPTVNNLFSIKLVMNYFIGPSYVIYMALITIIIGLISGSYISIYLSGLKPITILNRRFQTKGSKAYFGISLIIIQICLFSGLIFSSLIIYNQIHYALSKNQGFNKNNLLELSIAYINDNQEFVKPFHLLYSQFIDEINQNSNIVNASGCVMGPITNSWSKSVYSTQNNPDKQVSFENMPIKHNFIETMEFDLISGRSFSENYASDSLESVVINEQGVRELGISDPIGKIIKGKNKDKIIIGVIKDFHMHTIHEKISPIILYLTEDKFLMEIVIRYKEDRIKEVINFLKEKWKEYGALENRFKVVFYTDKIENKYGNEKDFGRNLFIFSLIAIITACLGLFGFSLLIARQKIKEIGIRKALGASIWNINKLMIKQFIIMSIIANMISQPISYLIMKKWLNNFAYKSPFDPMIIIVCLLLTCIFVVLTIYTNIYITARKNPVETLRYE